MRQPGADAHSLSSLHQVETKRTTSRLLHAHSVTVPPSPPHALCMHSFNCLIDRFAVVYT